VLAFKSDDLQTPDGINKMRAALLTHLNEALVRLLGGERVAQWTGDEKKGLIKNIYFPTLVVE
jgi:flagellar basal body-associated protein FliL